VRKLIGIHRARYLVTGAAPISPELVKWYLALGVPMLEVWGMTETCGASTGVPAAHQARLDRPGGRLQRGAAGPGHGRNPGARPQRLRRLPEPAREDGRDLHADGWLHTGDVGTVDAEGFYRITDRMKDIIITAGGKNITPSELENELKFSPTSPTRW
jgi:long-chain acyl-CoA synthetase